METNTERAQWTKEETKQLIDLAKAGHTSAEICKLTGRSYSSISTEAARISLQFRSSRGPKDFDPATQKDRPCLSCGLSFISGWIGIRICDECKERPEWRSA